VEVIGGAPELWVAGSTVIVVTPVMAAMGVVVGCDIVVCVVFGCDIVVCVVVGCDLVVCGVGGGFGCGVELGPAGVPPMVDEVGCELVEVVCELVEEVGDGSSTTEVGLGWAEVGTGAGEATTRDEAGGDAGP
jgi:hypothetical protein